MRVKELLKPYRGRILLLSVMTIAQSVLQVGLAVLMRFVIDAALAQKRESLFWGGMLVADLAALVAVHTLLGWYTGSTQDQFVTKLRYRIVHAAAFSRDKRLQAYHSGQMLNRGMEDVNTVCDGAISALPAMVGQITALVTSFLAIAMMHPALAGILAVLAVIIGALAGLIRPVLKREHRRVRSADEKMFANMQEDLQQLELVQGLQMQKTVLSHFYSRLQKTLKAKHHRRIWMVGSTGIVNFAMQLGTGVFVLWGASRLSTGALSYGSLTAILQLLSLFRTPVLGLSGLWSKLSAVEVAGERLIELLTVEEQSVEKENITSAKAVVFENVTFAYSQEEAPVLSSFSARFPLDGWTCLTGISGKGKSTMFKLILGLYTPQTGRVYLETDAGEVLCSEKTRHLFAYVPQDYALFSVTIEENLKLVAPDADDTTRNAALTAAGAEFVQELALGEQTEVRENNTGLSKGQLQRIAIARALLMNRPILLLDECTSALDAQTEERVLKNLQERNVYAIVVTHHPQALPNVTEISMEDM